jgi:hypothetical protein
MDKNSKKIGATPVPEGALGGGEIRGMMPVKWRGMIHLRDGHGVVMTKMISVFENGDVYFEENGKFTASQNWLKNAVAKKLTAMVPEDKQSFGEIPQG